MNNIPKLLKNERLDDLQFKDLYIIQNKEMYCFTSDAVLLANFAKATAKDTAVDLCSGSGVVGILFSAKTKVKSVCLAEIQPEFCDMAERSVQLNNLSDKIKVVNTSVQNAPSVLGREMFSIVLCNPPYKVVGSHKITADESLAMCKYETRLTFDELCDSTSKLLKYGGKFYFIHESCRLSEIITTLKKYNLETKRIQFVYPKTDSVSNVMLVEAVRCGKSGLIVESPKHLGN